MLNAEIPTLVWVHCPCRKRRSCSLRHEGIAEFRFRGHSHESSAARISRSLAIFQLAHTWCAEVTHVRQSLESEAELAVDRHLTAVANLVASWTITSARDLAWNNCLLLWAVRDDPIARGLFLDALAASTALASRMLLVAV